MKKAFDKNTTEIPPEKTFGCSSFYFLFSIPHEEKKHRWERKVVRPQESAWLARIVFWPIDVNVTVLLNPFLLLHGTYVLTHKSLLPKCCLAFLEVNSFFCWYNNFLCFLWEAIEVSLFVFITFLCLFRFNKIVLLNCQIPSNSMFHSVFSLILFYLISHLEQDFLSFLLME